MLPPQQNRHRGPLISSSDPPMCTNLRPVLCRELENLKGPESCKSAMEALKSYVEDLDSKLIPVFLAQVSETNDTGAFPGECIISLYELLARVHGPNIVPHIDDIMSTIVQTLSSTDGSLTLHQACCKVVTAIARYGIDPVTPEDEKTRIIGSLVKPLSDILMGSINNAASGAALCLGALMESDNWKFASDDKVNEVCLKVAGALEEKPTQTSSHMCLVVALSKHNGLIIEPYARSLIKSGLRILIAGVKEYDTNKRLQAIQTIHSLMQGADPRIYKSEIFKLVDAMEKCQNDSMHSVRAAASEVLQTAKMIAGPKASRHEICSRPLIGSNIERLNGRRHSWIPRDNEEDHDSPEFPSPESQTVDSFVDYDDTLVDSPLSMRHCNLDCAKRVNRSLWSNGNGGADEKLEDGFFQKAGLGEGSSTTCLDQYRSQELNGVQCDTHKGLSGASSEFTTTNVVARASTLGSQKSFQHSAGNVKSSLTPAMTHDEDGHSRNLDCDLRVRRINARMRKLTQRADAEGDALSIVLATPKNGAVCEENIQVRSLNPNRGNGSSLVVLCLVVIILAFILVARWIESDEGLPNVVPT